MRFAPEDRAFLAAPLTSLPRTVLRRLRLLVRPDTVLMLKGAAGLDSVPPRPRTLRPSHVHHGKPGRSDGASFQSDL